MSDLGGVGPVKNRKLVTIKPGQAIISAQPEVAIRGLNHGGDIIIRQTLFTVPAINQIPARNGRALGPPGQYGHKKKKITAHARPAT